MSETPEKFHSGTIVCASSSTKQTLFPSLPQLPLPPGVLPAAVSLAASFTVLFAVTWWTGKPEGDDVDDDVAAVMEL